MRLVPDCGRSWSFFVPGFAVTCGLLLALLCMLCATDCPQDPAKHPGRPSPFCPHYATPNTHLTPPHFTTTLQDPAKRPSFSEVLSALLSMFNEVKARKRAQRAAAAAAAAAAGGGATPAGAAQA